VEKWSHVSWKRVAFALLIVFGSLGVIVGIDAVLEQQLAPWLAARDLCRDNPHLNLLPIARQDKSQARLSDERFGFNGFSFQTPSKKFDFKRNGKGISVLTFEDGGTIIVFNPVQDFDPLKLMRSDARLARTLGPEVIRSNYALMAAEMAATSDQVKWWRTPGQNARSSTLLAMKNLVVLHLAPIYSIASDEMHGFQFGNPAIAPYTVELDLFDRNDRRYQIIINGRGGHSPVLTQPEINAMVASFRPIPHS
jgi:hypothetical protein